MFMIEARRDSGFQSDGRYEQMNYRDPYLITAFGFMGITDITFIHIENDEFGGQTLVESITNARYKITKLVTA